MLVAALGVVVAATLLAVGPIYALSMSDLGLRHRLERGLDQPRDQVAYLEYGGLRIGDAVDASRVDVMSQITRARVGWLGVGEEVIDHQYSGRLDLAFPAFADQAPEEPLAVTAFAADPPRQHWGAFIHALSNLEGTVEVTEGRLPDGASAAAEVVLPDGFRRHAQVGDVISFTGPRYNDCQRLPLSDDPTVAVDEVVCRPTATVSTSGTATIVGFVQPREPDDPRWYMFAGSWETPDEPFFPRLTGFVSDNDRAQAFAGRGSMPLITTPEQLLGAFGAALPELPTTYRSGFVPDVAALALRDVPRAIADMGLWGNDASDATGLTLPVFSSYRTELLRFRNTQTFSQVPLLIILLQVVGIVIYYVSVVMGLLLDRQAEEVGVYRSRGASTSQILGFTLIEGLVIAIPAALAGPWLASWVVRLLGLTPTFRAVTGGELLPVFVPPDAALLSAAGAALALLAMLAPAFVAARRGIVDVKREQSRPPRRSVLQRYYLDFAAVAFALLLLVQLRQRGSVFDPNAVGGWSADPMLMLSPLVFTIAVAAMVLRFYPPLLRLGVRVLLLFRGTAVAIGLRRAGRSPSAYARLLLLLVMAVAVGTFAASYGPTVDRSHVERIRYLTGADVRAGLTDTRSLDLEQRVQELRTRPEVQDAAIVLRGELQAPNGRAVPMLALDPVRAASMLWFREDFATETLESITRRLRSAVPPGGGLALPDDTRLLELSVFTDGEPGREFLQAVLRDGNGHGHLVSFETPDRPGWVATQADVLSATPRPLTLVAIRVLDRLGQNLRSEGALYFDDIVAIDERGARTTVEDYEGPFQWTQYAPRGSDEPLSLSTERAQSGEHAAKWEWRPTITPREHTLALLDPAVPLAAVMSGPALGLFLTSGTGKPEALIADLLVPLDVRAVIDLFPTMSPDAGFVIVSFEQFKSLSATVNNPKGEFPTEIWINFNPGVSLETQQQFLDGLLAAGAQPVRLNLPVLHRQAEIEAVTSDPTLQASGSGILAVAFIAVLGLSTLGFVVTLVLGARARSIEFAVLRAVGSSRRQILRAMLLEWGIVLAIGGVIGVLLGRRVAAVMLSFLEVTEEGNIVIPPFVLLTDWRTLGIGIGALAAFVLIALGVTWAAAMRRASAATLRITQ